MSDMELMAKGHETLMRTLSECIYRVRTADCEYALAIERGESSAALMTLNETVADALDALREARADIREELRDMRKLVELTSRSA